MTEVLFTFGTTSQITYTTVNKLYSRVVDDNIFCLLCGLSRGFFDPNMFAGIFRHFENLYSLAFVIELTSID